jgi:hypothetical protein
MITAPVFWAKKITPSFALKVYRYGYGLLSIVLLALKGQTFLPFPPFLPQWNP